MESSATANESLCPLPRISPLQWALPAGIVALAIVLRLLWLGSFEANFDELWHMEVSTGRGTAHSTLPKNVLIERQPDVTSLREAPPWTSIYTHMNGNTHPPLYWMALRIWRECFGGDSLARARALNVIFSALSIVALFWTVRALSGATTPALWAALILALSSAQIEAAQEVRNYPLATLCWLCIAGVVATAGRQQRLGWPGAVALALSTLATLLCLYVAAAVIATTWLYALLRLRGTVRLRAVGAISVGAVLFIVLWGPQFRRQREAFAAQASYESSTEERVGQHLRSTLRRAANVPVRMLFEPRNATTFVSYLGAVMYLLPWLLLRRHPDALLWGASLVAVVALATALDLYAGTQHLDLTRHTLLAGPPTVALIATLAAASMRFARLVPPVVALACALALGQTYLRQDPQYSDIGSFLSDPATAGEPVVFYSDPDKAFWSEWMFVGAAHYSGTFPRPVVRLDAPISRDVVQQLHAWSHVWVVSGATSSSAEQIVPGTVAVDVRQNPHLGTVTRLRWVSPSTTAPSTAAREDGRPR